MASSLALRRLLSSAVVVPRTLRPVVSSRLLNTNASRTYEETEDEGFDMNHRSKRTVLSSRSGDLFSDLFEPFKHTTTRTFLQGLTFVDQSDETSGWDAKEKDDGLHLRIDMPGLSREDVKLALEQNTLVINGEGEEEDGRKFSSRIGLPEKVYKTDEIKAVMKNGVLRVVVPKMKEDERNNVRHILVD